jgi:tetratricopeptide (TPR) repeat protein
VNGSVHVAGTGFEVWYDVTRCTSQGASTLLRRRESFGWGDAVNRYAGISNAIASALRRDIPSELVAVDGFMIEGRGDSTARRIANRLADVVGDSISFSDELAVDSSARNYRVSGRLRFGADGAVEATVQVRPAGHEPLSSPAIRGVIDSLDRFYRRVAAEAMVWLRGARVARRLGEDLGPMTAATLITRARELLCIDADAQCRPDYAATAELMRSTTRLEPANWEPRFLLGLAELRQGNAAAAVRALREADSLGAVRPPASRLSKETQARVTRALAEGYDALRNYGDAAAAYDRAANLDPEDRSVRIAVVRSLRLAGHQDDAWNRLVAGGGDLRTLPGFDDEFLVLLREAPATTLAQQLRVITDVCNARAPVRARCADLVFEAARSLSDSLGDQAASRSAFGGVLRLRSIDPILETRVTLYLARSYLGSPSLSLDSTGCFRPTASEFVPDSLERYLGQAQRRLRETEMPENLREWAARLRALDLLARGDLIAAAAAIDSARHHLDTDDGKFVAAEVRFGRGQERERSTMGACSGHEVRDSVANYYRDAVTLVTPLVASRYDGGDWVLMQSNHALRKDTETRKALEAVLKQWPHDVQALSRLSFVCYEYLAQPSCSLDARARLMDEGGARDLADTLDAVEGALGADRADLARKWLGPGQGAGRATPDDRVVREFLRTWLAAAERRAPDLDSGFAAWTGALNRFRAGTEVLNWSFRGSRSAIARSKLDPCYRKLLLDMIGASEARAGPLPARGPCRDAGL